MEELVALRHDEREFRRRWMARVDAWCKSLREGGGLTLDADLKPVGKARGVIESVLKELADIGEPEGSALAGETRTRLEMACRAGVEAAARSVGPEPVVLDIRDHQRAETPRGKTA